MAFRRLFGGGEERAGENFIDLTDYSADITSAPAEGGMYVKIAEITDYNQLRDVTNFVYDGNVLVLRIVAISEDEEVMKKLTRDLKQLSYDINGDVAGLGSDTIIVTPSGVKVDRRKYEPRSS